MSTVSEISQTQHGIWRIGHRGAAAHAPDNTLSGFRRAVQLGADMVEFDVQRTADRRIAVIHDSYLVDPAGRLLPVRGSALGELQTVDLGDGERVPALEEVLDLCQEEQLGAYIELKDGACVEAVAQAIRDRDMTGGCIVGSFRPDWLVELTRLFPEVRTSVLFGSIHVEAVALAQSVGARYVHPCWERFPHPSKLLTPQWLANVRSAGLGIICWHEERPQEIAALRELGVDGICSDAPELLLG